MVANPAQDPSDLIAVVGMAGRFPGAPDTEGLWKLLMDRGDAIRTVPADRWDASGQLDPEREIQGVGGFIEGVDLFDAGFFGISPREAAAIDPQQRLLLEMGWRALEDAGQRTADLAGSRTGVYVGASWHDYELLRKERGARPTPHSLVGNALDVIAARMSYVFKLRGPSMTVETGCSSSLVALHLASQALRQGEIDAAIVGAANLMLDPHVTVGLTHFGALSPDGRCQTFSDSANGFVRGEGVAALYVKTLRRALEDGDRIHGVVVRTVVNNDGGGESLVTPSPEGQDDLLRRAYDGRVVPAGSPAYIEAHGTGTGRGDPIETASIGRILGGDRADDPVLVGSIKTNIGHLEAAAGMAGLFKLLLALRHRVLPPSLHAEHLNPDIPFDELNVRVVREPRPLPAAGPVYLGVNSFGWGGTNAHVVVMSPPEPTAPHPAPAAHPAAGLPPFLPLSAREPSVLAERVRQLANVVPAAADDGVPALAGTLAWRRDHFPERAAVLAADPEELRAGLASLADASGAAGEEAADSLPHVVRGRGRELGRTAFVFPGQGSQWNRMGQELFRDSPLFAEVVGRCAKALSPHVDWDLTAVFTGESGDEWMSRIDMLQPTLWAMSLGLAELWRAGGVEPDVVLGHSQGEITAATLAGILTYEDAALVMARRSAIARRTSGRGRMLAVDLDRETALAALEGFEDTVALAVHNGPSSCVLSGDDESVLMLRELLEADGTYCRLVNVDYASHSPQMDELRDDLLTALAPVRPRPGELELMSTVRGRLLDGPEMDTAYWVENLRSPVLFADAMTALLDSGVTHVVEISPHPVLAPAIEQLAASRAEPPAVLSTLRRHHGSTGDAALALARGYVAGLAPFGLLPRHDLVPVPGYPLKPQSHWIPERGHRAGSTPGFEAPLVPAPGEAGTWHAALEVSSTDLPWLADHRVHDTAVLPGTAMLTAALHTVRARWGALPRRLEHVVFHKGIAVTESPARLTAAWHDELADGGRFRLLSLPEGGEAWQVNAEAHAYRLAADVTLPRFPDWAVPSEPSEPSEPEEFYREWAARGLSYGPAFRTVRRIRLHGDGLRALGEVTLPEGLRAANRAHALHPALWDGALQISLALCSDLGDGAALVPTAIRSVQIHQEPEEPVTTLWSHAVRRTDGTLDVDLFDTAREPLMSLAGLRLEPLPVEAGNGLDSARLHHLGWTELPALGAARTPAAAGGGWAVCGGVDGTGAAVVAALRATGREAVLVPGPGLGPDDDPLAGVAQPEGVAWLAPRAEEGAQAQESGLGRLAALVRACADRGVPPRLTVVTVGAQAVESTDVPDPGAAMYWGFARVLRREHGELTPRVVDVVADDPNWADRCAAEVLGDDDEDQVALRGGRRLGARLIRGAVPEERLAALPPQHTRTQPFQLAPGSGDGALRYVPLARRVPGRDEVEIEVTAATLEPADTARDTALQRATAALHGFAGEVTAVGPGVSRPRPGDRVVACGPGAPATHVTVRIEHVRPLPEGLNDADAAALLPAGAIAWYALDEVGRLAAGETALIHSGVGAVAGAAVQIAGARGARVLVVADEAEDGALRALGAEQVLDARELSWPRAVREATGGRGADVVLCPATGSGPEYGLDALADDGRLIALTGQDATAAPAAGASLAPAALRSGVSVTSLDPAGLLGRRPEHFARSVDAVSRLISQGTLRPARARHLTFGETTGTPGSAGATSQSCVLVGPSTVERVTPLAMPDDRFRPDGTYVITGGLGALGLSLAEFLAANGAGALLLVGRSEVRPEVTARLEALRAGGTLVRTVRCDITDQSALSRALGQARRQLPPLRGVFHAAGVLADATVRTLTPEQIAAVVRPKADGARNLEAVTAGDPLDCFVLFSSAAALFGNAGQAAYAAANAALDACAEARRSRGLPALSVQWGPFSDVGLAAEDSRRGARLEERGMGGFPAAEAWPALARMLTRGEAVTGYVPLDLRQWFDAYPDAAACGSWQVLRAASVQGDGRSSTAGEFRARLAQAPVGERVGLIEAKIRELTSRVLRLAPEAVGREAAFKSLGLDSLMSLELRNRLESAFGLRLSPTLLWAYGSSKALAAALGEQLSAPPEGA
ncbi:SDR family NAD(P)-dependent oxidoreductase [Streptomyces sp. NPDC101151]|uniref:type I polyketide synthase n=1 Tax=Streptomyces sp. NPDC101151 TaxID=3366115 RepID=UPI0038257536